MKKILMLMAVLMMAAGAAQAQTTVIIAPSENLLIPAGSYIFHGDQAMNKQQCAEFLSTRHQPAYQKFQTGLKCVEAGWWTFGAGLAADLVGGLFWYYGEFTEKKNEAMGWAGLSFICAGGLAVIASIPTIYIGYEKMNNAIDMYNVSQASQPQAYWTIQGSQNGIGVALNF